MDKMEQSLQIINSQTYTKARIFTSAKYNATLWENKLIAMGFYLLGNGMYTEEKGDMEVTIHAEDIKRILGDSKSINEGSWYNTLENTASIMTGRTIGYSDPEKKEFEYISVITSAKYKNGEFKIRFNQDLKKYLTVFSPRYTQYNIRIMMSFKQNMAFRLYEILKAEAFIVNKKGNENLQDYVFDVVFQLSELKFMLGLVNNDLDQVKKELRGKASPDFDKALQVAAEKNYEDWYNLKMALNRAIKEINERTDITVEMEKMTGANRKVYAVRFLIRYKKDFNYNTLQVEKKITGEEKEEILDKVYEALSYVGYCNLKPSEIRKICEFAGYDLEKLLKACSSAYIGINDIVGFMHNAIRDDYESFDSKNKKAKAAASKSKKKKNQFNEFPQRTYDFEQLEMKLLSN